MDNRHPAVRSRVLAVLAWAALGGLVTAALYGAGAGDLPAIARSMAVGLAASAAAAAAGGLLGFLFAIPRLRADEDERPAAERSRFQPNTNLEQISDWLTKILVGAGLVQVGAIASGIGNLAGIVAAGLGDPAAPSSYPFALGLLLYFLVTGFVTAYLWTRLYLPDAFAEADQGAEELLNGMTFGASPDQAEPRLRAHMLEYQRLRDARPGSGERTMEMTRLVTEMRALAGSLNYTPEQVRALFDEGTPGARVAALALAREAPSAELMDVVTQAIASSRSAFEQYQALRAALAVAEEGALGDQQRQQLRAAIDGSPHITRGTDRYELRERIFEVIGPRG